MLGATTRFAVIGDYGDGSARQVAVSRLVKSWNPDFIITTGDNNYDWGAASTIDRNIGATYHEFIHPYRGAFGRGATRNRFFPALGNHDWYTAGAAPYLEYFTLPGNERYYDFVWGPVHLFALDSDEKEPDGVTADSAQALWLQTALAAASSCWRIVYMHHPPYSSGIYGPTPALRWPYKEWGASAVLAGHDHTYERLSVQGLDYFVNGLGGSQATTFRPAPASGSQARYNSGYGAMRVTASARSITYEFVTTASEVIDRHTVSGGCRPT